MEPNHFEALYPADTRREEIKKVIEAVRSGGSCQVIGLPGAGKSNVMRLLPYNRTIRETHLGKNEPNFHFIYMDFSEVRDRNLFDVIKFILISISYSLGERRLTTEQTTVNEFLKEALSFKDELILFQALKKSVDYLAMEKNLNLVFLFDRFENYIPEIDYRFFLDLKVIRSRLRHNFSVVFAVGRPIEDVIEPAIYADFYEFVGNNIYLPIKDAPGLAFRFPYLEKITGKKAKDEVKQEIERLTAGHGKLARVCFEACLADSPVSLRGITQSGMTKQSQAIDRFAMARDDKSTLEEFLLSKSQVKGTLLEIWNYLTPSEQDDIKNGDKNEFLEKIHLTNIGNITIPLFEKYVKNVPQTPAGKLKYDAEKNEILKGKENLTDKLTPSEFRLLKFLMTNQERICEKDEIITGVWRDTKTQEGVTDQALDQIIYRLRKKIENDPNNPRFIQTVKGRGYKFNE